MIKTPTFFVDFDGVLLPYTRPGQPGPEGKGGSLNIELVDRVCSLAESLGAQIVISSAWRGLYRDLETFLAAHPRFGSVICDQWKTPPHSGLRGEDVCTWLDTNGWRPYVIFDDETDFYRWQPVIYTDAYVGLTEDQCKKAKDLLLGQVLDGVFKGGMRYKLGDFLMAPHVIVAHGCNAQGAMGSGAALAVINRYPLNKKTYQLHHQARGLTLGEVVWHLDKDDDLQQSRLIANCITQEFAGHDGRRYVDYDAIRTSYGAVADMALANDWDTIATCQVGAGLAGGDWGIILDILEELGIEKGVTILVYFLDSDKFYDACSQYRTFAHAERHSKNRLGSV